MSLKKYSQEEIKQLPMIELANLILLEGTKAIDFRKIYERVADLKGFNKTQKDEYIAQFYTDLNIDGRFMTIGSNLWGLKQWYPIEQVEEEITAAPKKKKKKAATKKPKKEVVIDEAEDEDLTEEKFGFDDTDLDEDPDDYDNDNNYDNDDDYDEDLSDDEFSEDDDDKEDEEEEEEK